MARAKSTAASAPMPPKEVFENPISTAPTAIRVSAPTLSDSNSGGTDGLCHAGHRPREQFGNGPVGTALNFEDTESNVDSSLR